MTLFNSEEKALILYPRLAVALKGIIDEKSIVNAALVINQIDYWCKLNEEKGVNHREGRFWAFSTYTEWIERDFIFWSKNTLIRTIEKLEKANLLISTSKFNKKKYDKTKWYTPNYEELNKVWKAFLNSAKKAVEIEEKATTQDEYTVEEKDDRNTEKQPKTDQNTENPLPKMGRPPTQDGYPPTQDGYMEEPKMGRPIQDIKKEINKKINNDNLSLPLKNEEEEKSTSTSKKVIEERIKQKRLLGKPTDDLEKKLAEFEINQTMSEMASSKEVIENDPPTSSNSYSNKPRSTLAELYKTEKPKQPQLSAKEREDMALALYLKGEPYQHLYKPDPQVNNLYT